MHVCYNAHRHVTNFIWTLHLECIGNVNMAKINERYYVQTQMVYPKRAEMRVYSSLINTSYAAFKTACKTIHK